MSWSRRLIRLSKALVEERLARRVSTTAPESPALPLAIGLLLPCLCLRSLRLAVPVIPVDVVAVARCFPFVSFPFVSFLASAISFRFVSFQYISFRFLNTFRLLSLTLCLLSLTFLFTFRFTPLTYV